MGNPHANGIAMYFNLQNVYFSSTIAYRWCVQHFPPDLNRLLPLNLFDYFAIHFDTILIRFPCILGFWSLRILH